MVLELELIVGLKETCSYGSPWKVTEISVGAGETIEAHAKLVTIE